MNNYKNNVDHKCPCCGYEAKFDWGDGNPSRFIKGDESFVVIFDNCKASLFETDIPNKNNCISGLHTKYEFVMLLGCPKCKTVSYKIW